MNTRHHDDDSATAPPGRTETPESGIPAELANHTKFRVVRLLGQGGMGSVYLGQDRLLERAVAIKVMAPELLGRPDALKRFLHEAKSIANLPPHPNVVQVYALDQAGPLHLLVMEFVQGIDLAKYVVDKGALPGRIACHLLRQAALGLQHAHEHGMVHRDIKPNNLIVTPKGQLKILDFGLAKLANYVPGKPTSLTGDKAIMGTVDYMAPEQAMSARTVDIRADLYSLGCTAYYLLTGRPPFEGDGVNALSVLLCHQTSPPPALRELRSDVPPELANIIAKLLAKAPQDRYQKPLELAVALAPFVKETPGTTHDDEKRPKVEPQANKPTLSDAATRATTPNPLGFTPPTTAALHQPARKKHLQWLLVANLVVVFIVVGVGLFLLVHKLRNGSGDHVEVAASQDTSKPEAKAEHDQQPSQPNAPKDKDAEKPSGEKNTDPPKSKDNAKSAPPPADATEGKSETKTEDKGAVKEPPVVRPVDTRTARAKRLDRWLISLNHNTGAEYVQALAQQSAILILVDDSGRLLLIDHSARPIKTTATTLDELRGLARLCTRLRRDDVATLQAVQKTLGLRRQPKGLVAFFPRDLEDVLLTAELAKAQKTEDEVNADNLQTRFTVARAGGNWNVAVVEQTKPKDAGKSLLDLREADEPSPPTSPLGSGEANGLAQATLATLRSFDGKFADEHLATIAKDLSRLGPQGLDALIAGLSSSSATVQLTATRAVGHQAAVAARAAPALRKLLSSDSKPVVVATMSALGSMGPTASEAVEDLGRHYFGSDPPLKRAAGDALAAIGPASLPVFGDRLKEKRTRMAALEGLAKLGADARPLTKEVEAFKADPDASVRILVLRVLRRADKDFAKKSLLNFLKDDGSQVRHEAVRTAAEFGDLPKEAVEELAKLLRTEKEGSERNAVVAALVRQQGAALQLLLKAIKDEDFNVRKAALDAFDQLGPHAAPVAKDLTLHLGSGTENFVRLRILKTLEKMGPKARDAVLFLTKLEKEDDFPAVRKAAKEALAKIKE